MVGEENKDQGKEDWNPLLQLIKPREYFPGFSACSVISGNERLTMSNVEYIANYTETRSRTSLNWTIHSLVTRHINSFFLIAPFFSLFRGIIPSLIPSFPLRHFRCHYSNTLQRAAWMCRPLIIIYKPLGDGCILCFAWSIGIFIVHRHLCSSSFFKFSNCHFHSIFLDYIIYFLSIADFFLSFSFPRRRFAIITIINKLAFHLSTEEYPRNSLKGIINSWRVFSSL